MDWVFLNEMISNFSVSNKHSLGCCPVPIVSCVESCKAFELDFRPPLMIDSTIERCYSVWQSKALAKMYSQCAKQRIIVHWLDFFMIFLMSFPMALTAFAISIVWHRKTAFFLCLEFKGRFFDSRSDKFHDRRTHFETRKVCASSVQQDLSNSRGGGCDERFPFNFLTTFTSV